MHRINAIMMTSALALGIVSASFAQGRIAQRRENQQDRIAQGVANGTLSPSETANLETKEAKLNKEIRTDRKENGGNLTNKQKAQINRQQNRLSNQIYAAKHDGRHR